MNALRSTSLAEIPLAAPAARGAAGWGNRTMTAAFGTYAPTPLQRAIIAAGRVPPLSRGKLRHGLCNLLTAIRPGPLDVQRLGLNLRISLEHGPVYRKLLLDERNYDRQEIAALTTGAAADFRFADLGANAGIYSLTIKAQLPKARIIAFEALPKYANELAFNIEANALDDVTLVNDAVGASRDTQRFYTDGQSLIGNGPAIDVPVVPLYDTLVENGFDGLDAMKIDIEGAEEIALLPFFATAPQAYWPRVIVLEHTHPEMWGGNLLTRLHACGYRPTSRTGVNSIMEREART